VAGITLYHAMTSIQKREGFPYQLQINF